MPYASVLKHSLKRYNMFCVNVCFMRTVLKVTVPLPVTCPLPPRHPSSLLLSVSPLLLEREVLATKRGVEMRVAALSSFGVPATSSGSVSVSSWCHGTLIFTYFYLYFAYYVIRSWHLVCTWWLGSIVMWWCVTWVTVWYLLIKHMMSHMASKSWTRLTPGHVIYYYI